MAEHDLLGHSTAHRPTDHVVEIPLRVRVPLFGQAPGDAQGHAAREDGDLVERVAVGQHDREDGVAAFVDGGCPLLLGAEHQALAAGAHDDTVASVLEVDSLDLLAASSNREECCFVDEVREVGAAHAGCGLRHDFEVDVGAHALVAAVHLQDGQTFFVLGQRHDDLTVEASGAQERRVEDVGPVGGGQDDDALTGLEAVHLGEHLVEGLLALVVPAADTGTALATDGVDLVDEDDGPAQLAGLGEQVAHAAGADTDEHLHEVGAGDTEEADAGFTRDSAGEQGLAGARRADQQHALGHACADLTEPLGPAQEVDHFGDLLLDALVAGDVGERGAGLVGLVGLRPAAADGHDVAHLPLRPAVHPHQEADDEQERQEEAQRAE